MEKKERKLNYDLIRIIACFTILAIHFNASISGYDYSGEFLHSNSIIPNFYFGCVYLGEIGNSLFFILSGASLMCNTKDNFDINKNNIIPFYYKRALAIYPPFWIAFILSMCAQLLFYHNLPNAQLYKIILSFLGIDGYAWNRGWFDGGFYQIGEWYLGCVLICYLLWPAVTFIWKKVRLSTLIVGTIIVYILSLYLSNGNDKIVFVRMAEMIAGGLFTLYFPTAKKKLLVIFSLINLVGCILLQEFLHPISVTFAVCWMIFIIVSLVVESHIEVVKKYEKPIVVLSSLTYPLFLVHHKVISIIASRFELRHYEYRYIIVFFIIYIAISMFVAILLKKVSKHLVLFIIITRDWLSNNKKKFRRLMPICIEIFIMVLVFGFTYSLVEKMEKKSIEIIDNNLFMNIPHQEAEQPTTNLWIDYCNDIAQTEELTVYVDLKSKDVISINGWAADLVNFTPLSDLYVDVGGTIIQCNYGSERNTVAEYFGNDNLINTGYSVDIPVVYLQQGKVDSLDFIGMSYDGSFRLKDVRYKIIYE